MGRKELRGGVSPYMLGEEHCWGPKVIWSSEKRMLTSVQPRGCRGQSGNAPVWLRMGAVFPHVIVTLFMGDGARGDWATINDLQGTGVGGLE